MNQHDANSHNLPPLNQLASLPLDQTALPGRDPDLAAKIAQVHAELTAQIGVPLPEAVTGSQTQSEPANALSRLRKHSGKLAVSALFASTLLFSACGNQQPSCTTTYATPSVASNSTNFGDTPAPNQSSTVKQTPVAVQYCQDTNGNHYYTGGFYGGSHYYGGGGFSGSSSS